MSDSPKKYKKPKQKTPVTTNPETRKPTNNRDEDRSECPEQVCPLLAKDSEWVDILQPTLPEAQRPSSSSVGDDEAILQLVDCDDDPQMKPLAIMFPGLVERDPQTLEGMLTKAMSTTEVTRNLVNLGEKADFTFMKKSNRLIPPDKIWLESLAENSNSHCSLESDYFLTSSSEYEADTEYGEDEISNEVKEKKRRKKKLVKENNPQQDSIRAPQTSGPIPKDINLEEDNNNTSENDVTYSNHSLICSQKGSGGPEQAGHSK